MGVKDDFIAFIHTLQDEICGVLEQEDGKAKFQEDRWNREGGGGGITRVIADGNVFEKGGVNTSAVFGSLPAELQKAMSLPESNFFAAGLSLVIHPVNPFVPTVHANWRMFELYDKNTGALLQCWFGGGTDLTPYYVFEEDGRHFHGNLKSMLDRFGEELYPNYKRQCDEYFINKHRDGEMRGIGGIFYDYLRPDGQRDASWYLDFQKANGHAFLPGYVPIVSKNKNVAYGTPEIEWQEIRRGRYVEFNLIHDRGTLFGLKTNGRTESILMSLPPRARWRYDYHPAPGTREAEMMKYFKPKDWM
jgi:coproporphyrinogen III oxidase